MNKAAKKFRWSAVLAIFVLLTVLLAVINGMNFTMASEDADMITQMLADQRGKFPGGDMKDGGAAQSRPDEKTSGDAAAASEITDADAKDSAAEDAASAAEDTAEGSESSETAAEPTKKPYRDASGRMGPMGPSSPDVTSSVRYFTFAYSSSGKKVETVAFHISAVTEEEAEAWAEELLGQNATGWTHGTYRYRVYEKNEKTYVTVIDQGRELLPSYRILIISIVGEVICLILCWIVLLLASRKLFAPLEDADRKQKKFIVGAEKEFRLPLTVISADTELLEREHGPSDYTRSIHRQVKKMDTLVRKLGTMGIYKVEDEKNRMVPLSDFLRAALEKNSGSFAEKNIAVHTEIEPDVVISANPEAMNRMVDELVDNALKYAQGSVDFRLRKEGERILLETSNAAALSDGSYNQAFDRFTKLENAAGNESAGLGLAYVKDIVKAHAGRAGAEVSGGVFTLKITL